MPVRLSCSWTATKTALLSMADSSPTAKTPADYDPETPEMDSK